MNVQHIAQLYSVVGDKLSDAQKSGVIDLILAHGAMPVGKKRQVLRVEALARYVSEINLSAIPAEMVFEARSLVGAALRVLRARADAGIADDYERQYAMRALLNAMRATAHGVRLLSDVRHPGLSPAWMEDSMMAFAVITPTAGLAEWRYQRANPLPGAWDALRELQDVHAARLVA